MVGVEHDFEDLITGHNNYYVGFFTSKKNKSYSNKKKKLGKENLKDWKKIKKNFNPDIFITIDSGLEREKLYKKIYKKNYSNLIVENSYVSHSSKKYLLKKRGIIIQRFVKIMPNVKINNGVKVNVNCQIHHGSKIGKLSNPAKKNFLFIFLNIYPKIDSLFCFLYFNNSGNGYL